MTKTYAATILITTPDCETEARCAGYRDDTIAALLLRSGLNERIRLERVEERGETRNDRN